MSVDDTGWPGGLVAPPLFVGTLVGLLDGGVGVAWWTVGVGLEGCPDEAVAVTSTE